ncbi:MAG: hypothetical protein ABIR71_11445 [Chthoniobacterales bacterium]
MKPSIITLTGGGIVLALLAAFALSYLFTAERPGAPARPNAPAATATAATATGPTATGPTPEAALPREPVMVLTKLESKTRRLRRGRKKVSVRIGVAPRAKDLKGAIDIRVFFFDKTETNELRTTDAEVDYRWLTRNRDWNDPATKFLVATYVSLPRPREAPEEYGGYLVRLYFDGQLQDERSEPEEILAVLQKSGTNPIVVAGAGAPTLAEPATDLEPAEFDRGTPALEEDELDDVATASGPITPAPAPTEEPKRASASSSAVPYASPVPDKPGFVYSPYDEKYLIDVRGFPPGTELNDPNTGKPLRVP